MPFPFDKYPWLNFQELNLAYFIKHFREIFEQWNTLLNEMHEWKDATDAELAEWKSTVETGISSWETGLQQSMEDWKDETEADISAWEAATLAALDAWKTATTAAFEQIRTEAAASAQAAAGSASAAQTALAGAQAAQAAAEAAAAGIQSELAQIQTNTAGIADLKTQLNKTNQAVFNGTFDVTQNDFEQGGFSAAQGKFDSLYRIRLKNVIECGKGTKIIFPNNGLYYICWYLRTENLTTPDVITDTGWVDNTTIIVPVDCYMYMITALSKTGETTTEPEDFTGEINITITTPETKSIVNLQDEIEKIKSGLNELYFNKADFVQAGFSATDFTTSTQRITSKDCIALPYGNKTKLKITMDYAVNGEYLFAVRAGRTPQNLSSNLYWFKSGDIISFNSNEQYYRLIFAHGVNMGTYYTYYDIEPADIDNISPHIEYFYNNHEEVMDLLTGNADNMERLINAKNVLSATSHGDTSVYPIIFHGSDFHGDYERVKNALFYAEHCDADAIVLSGDIIANRPLDGANWIHDLFAEFDGKPIVCIGNHEVTQDGITDAQVYDYFMKDSAVKIGNSNAKTYYYTDIPGKSLRIISVDLYQYGGTTRSNTHMTSEQLTYICNAIKTTPSGYGIIMVSHTPCVDVANLMDSDYSTFFQSLRKYGFTHYDINGAPIYDIVDAFNARTTINRTYTQTGSPSSISISDDFSNVENSIEFIAHMTGHIHEDSVCYLPTTTKQLMLNICCSVAMSGGSYYPYLADDCDITRLPYDKTQDAINAYVINRDTKTIKIVRIGGTLTYDMKKREYMEIPYSD